MKIKILTEIWKYVFGILGSILNYFTWEEFKSSLSKNEEIIST